MEYKGEEILARVYISQSGSDLYTLTDNGELHESLDVYIEHDDEEKSIVWYEVDGMENTEVEDPKTKEKLAFIQIPTVEEAKRRIDLYKAWCRKEYPEDYEDEDEE